MDNSKEQEYWNKILADLNLGLNRGTTFHEEEEEEEEEDILLAEMLARENERRKHRRKGKKSKGGAPKGRRTLKKSEVQECTRATLTPAGPVHQFGGIVHHGYSQAVGGGKGQRGGRKGIESGRDDQHQSGAFIQYVGDSNDLAILDETVNPQTLDSE